MQAKRYFLKGIDYFQLLIDHHSKQKGGPGHEARLAIFLEGRVNTSQLSTLLLNNEIVQQLLRIRVSKTFGLGYPSIVFGEKTAALPIEFIPVKGNEIPENYFNIPVDVYHKPPFHIHVFTFENNTSCILFAFHHILFDFAGVQSLIRCIAANKSAPLIVHDRVLRSFNSRFKGFFREVFHTFREANASMTIPSAKLPDTRPLQIVYKELVFTESETITIHEQAKSEGLQLNNSLYFLAAASLAMHHFIFSKQPKHNFIWVPVPVNNRKRGTTPAILFNGLTFLFYKIPSGGISDLTSLIKELKVQMKEQMRNDMPNAFIDFVEGYKFMPMPFYYPMLNLPSWGKLSSFSFSVLGDTFRDLDTFAGLPVTDIKNYPSNSVSPGITFLFYEYKNQLRVMTSWVKGQYSDEVQNNVLEDVRKILTGQ